MASARAAGSTAIVGRRIGGKRPLEPTIKAILAMPPSPKRKERILDVLRGADSSAAPSLDFSTLKRFFDLLNPEYEQYNADSDCALRDTWVNALIKEGDPKKIPLVIELMHVRDLFVTAFMLRHSTKKTLQPRHLAAYKLLSNGLRDKLEKMPSPAEEKTRGADVIDGIAHAIAYHPEAKSIDDLRKRDPGLTAVLLNYFTHHKYDDTEILQIVFASLVRNQMLDGGLLERLLDQFKVDCKSGVIDSGSIVFSFPPVFYTAASPHKNSLQIMQILTDVKKDNAFDVNTPIQCVRAVSRQVKDVGLVYRSDRKRAETLEAPSLQVKLPDAPRQFAVEQEMDLEQGLSLLMMAAKLGDIEKVKYLVNIGADVDAYTLNGNALTYAMAAGHKAVVRFLLEEKNANPFPSLVSGRDHDLKIRQYLIRAVLNILFKENAPLRLYEMAGFRKAIQEFSDQFLEEISINRAGDILISFQKNIPLSFGSTIMGKWTIPLSAELIVVTCYKLMRRYKGFDGLVRHYLTGGGNGKELSDELFAIVEKITTVSIRDHRAPSTPLIPLSLSEVGPFLEDANLTERKNITVPAITGVVAPTEAIPPTTMASLGIKTEMTPTPPRPLGFNYIQAEIMFINRIERIKAGDSVAIMVTTRDTWINILVTIFRKIVSLKPSEQNLLPREMARLLSNNLYHPSKLSPLYLDRPDRDYVERHCLAVQSFVLKLCDYMVLPVKVSETHDEIIRRMESGMLQQLWDYRIPLAFKKDKMHFLFLALRRLALYNLAKLDLPEDVMGEAQNFNIATHVAPHISPGFIAYMKQMQPDDYKILLALIRRFVEQTRALGGTEAIDVSDSGDLLSIYEDMAEKANASRHPVAAAAAAAAATPLLADPARLMRSAPAAPPPVSASSHPGTTHIVGAASMRKS